MSRYGAEVPGIDVEQRNQGWIWSRGTRDRFGADEPEVYSIWSTGTSGSIGTEEPGVDMEERNQR
jgi:hypothetical protein